ncbi:MAG: hypothetical protein KJ070_02540 [Verrucomicrobia bacterium]|nr:hypothetical protein [Verrucomicrobiota bacterium]
MKRISPLLKRNRVTTGGSPAAATAQARATDRRLAKTGRTFDSHAGCLSSPSHCPRVSPSLRIQVTPANRLLLRWMRDAEMAAWQGT